MTLLESIRLQADIWERTAEALCGCSESSPAVAALSPLSRASCLRYVVDTLRQEIIAEEERLKKENGNG